MSTRGARRWCPDCHGQVYFHHHEDGSTSINEDGSTSITTRTADVGSADVYYCQGCGRLVTEADSVKQELEEE